MSQRNHSEGHLVDGFKHTPTWQKACERCGTTLARWRGDTHVECGRCGAQYNAVGQRLRDDWMGNRSAWDEEVSDMDGYESQYAGDL